MPLISVVIAYYQHEKFIGNTISSLLAQTLDDIEIIVVDDNSSDGGMAIVEAFRDRRIRTIYRSSNGGPSAAMNDGIRVASGTFVALTGSDDVSEPWRLEHQVTFLTQRRASIAFSLPTLIDDQNRELKDQIFPIFLHQRQRDTAHAALRSLFVQGNSYCAPTALVKTDVFREIGLFDESLIQLQDFDFWLRACSHGHTIALGQRRVTRYRIHSENLSHRRNDERMYGELMRCYIKFLRDCPPEALARAFPEMAKPGCQEVDRAAIAIRHGSVMVQTIGKAMLLNRVWSCPSSHKSTSMDDAFVADVILAGLSPGTELTSEIGDRS